MERRVTPELHTAHSPASRPNAGAGDWFAVGPGGRYLGMEPLRPGGAAAPYRGWDREQHRLVVLKVLPEDAASEGWRARHLRREGEAAASFRHPALARLLDRGEHAARPFLVYEYFPGGSLADAFRAGSLRLPDFLDVIREAAAGLAYLHGHGWVHADVKPSNILFDESGRPRLADFGLTCRAGECTREDGHVIASEAYAAPEQRAGWPLSPAADVYSLCAVLYEGLEGRRWAPRRGGPLSSELPAELAGVLRRGLSESAAERYPDAAALLEALRACEVAALPPTPAGRRSRVDVPTLPRPLARRKAGTAV